MRILTFLLPPSQNQGEFKATLSGGRSGNIETVWFLDGQAMESAAGQATDLNLGVRMAPVQSADPIAAQVKPSVAARGYENGLVLSVMADGTLLSSAKLTVPAADRTGITAGSTVAVYRFDPNTGALSAVPGGIYTADANGNVTMDIPAGTRTGAKEIYVLLPAGMAAPPQASQASAAGAGGGTLHTVKAGDTLNQISVQYGCRLEDLLRSIPGWIFITSRQGAICGFDEPITEQGHGRTDILSMPFSIICDNPGHSNRKMMQEGFHEDKQKDKNKETAYYPVCGYRSSCIDRVYWLQGVLQQGLQSIQHGAGPGDRRRYRKVG